MNDSLLRFAVISFCAIVFAAFLSMMLTILLGLVYPLSASWASWLLCPGQTIEVETWTSIKSTTQFDYACRAEDGTLEKVSDGKMFGAMILTMGAPIAFLLIVGWYLLRRRGSRARAISPQEWQELERRLDPRDAARARRLVAPSAPAHPPADSIEQRLNEIESLRARGMISDAEYRDARLKILEDL